MNNAEVLIKFKGDTSDVDKSTKSLSSSMGKLTKSIALGNVAANAITKGIGIMTQNMDRAIQRIDTMNNFPKVMQNFGVSADEANKSIKRIDKTVQGLPTSLDQAVAGVQDLFMVTKDLKQSEKLFKAVNNSAMVFANGSTDAVNRFIYAFKQAMSAGKVSAQDFNQMNEAIPGLMSKVAEAMGVTYKELKEGLSDGSISIEKFNETLKKLDTEGVGSMQALEKAAKTSTGGIQTSIANMKTAFARGIADMIKRVDEALKPFGGISGVMSTLGKTVEKAFKKIGAILTVIIPKIVSFIKWLQKNINVIKFLVVVIGTLYAGFKTLMFVSTLVKVFQTFRLAISLVQIQALACGTSISTLRAALTLLNATFLACPLFWIIAGITALVVAFGVLWIKCEGFRNFFINMWNGITSFFQKTVEFIASLPQRIVDGFKSFVQFLNDLPGKIGYVLGFMAGKLVSFVVKDIPNFIAKFIQWFSTLPEKIRNIFSQVLSKMGQWIAEGVKKMKEGIPKIINAIVTAFKELPKKMIQIGKDIIKGLWNGIKSMGKWIKDKIGDFCKGVARGFKDAFKIGSPSKLMADEIGQWIPKGISVGIDANTDSIYKSINNLMDNIGLDPTLTSSMQNSFSPNVQVFNNVNVEQDPLGQVVSNIKTFSGGAKNDYNFGLGA